MGKLTYVCVVPYSDNYTSYKIGDTFEIQRLGGSGENGVWVYPVGGHPVQYEAFIFCFREANTGVEG